MGRRLIKYIGEKLGIGFDLDKKRVWEKNPGKLVGTSRGDHCPVVSWPGGKGPISGPTSQAIAPLGPARSVGGKFGANVFAAWVWFTEASSRKPTSPSFSRLQSAIYFAYGMGVFLSQITGDNQEHPIIYLSRKFSEVEKKYCVSEKECAVIIFGIQRLKHYLDGPAFTIVTDHNPLTWLKTNVSRNFRILRWSLALQPYNFTITHRKGTQHKNADALSRIPTLM
ncbi:Retrovirus-related Pol polyprotein like [Argiope bruennichi]|uniref:Retrovirus-related Pol polyprotein like n=1 Tax=Argiope bruennichi TaxID=94029 RepID=A0A8T0F4X4_ARGBR|nr:Retrovirus-related Pol polyprotein like [Argiope bruennichi]